ncbi:ABC transporter ATP-binding protein [Microbacterium sp. CJ77]|uniref:ABC transporter ATP-binding protein n=1 Tax=Microbacterium sp. CJ77 TaxID=2079201 RepID=UPI000CD8FF58|nr:ABC transporter ATP-binding protein [Microbacterium sp. CJ77]
MTIDRTTTATQERVGASLSVRDLRIHYGNVEAVKGISFDILPGEFLTLLGPSGCGKSTTLRCIAGLEPASAGTITIDDTVVAGPGKHVQPEKRGINMVFQSYAVWPHMTVEKNVGYGLKGLQKDEIKTRVDEVLDLIGLGKFAKRYGTELSGGQQQRVALARAIVTRPKVLGARERLTVPGIATPVLAAETAANDVHESASAVFRAESLLAGSAAESAENVWPAKVERVSYLGRHLDVLYSVGDSKVRGELPSATPIVVGDTVTIGIRASDVHFVPHTEV